MFTKSSVGYLGVIISGLIILGVEDTGLIGQSAPPEEGKNIFEEEVKAKIVEQEMILIKSGSFIRGTKELDKLSDEEKENYMGEINETPQYTVALKAFYIDKYEVTNLMYKKFVDETKYQPPKHWVEGVIPLGLENHPVVYVSWNDAVEYAKWAKKRLPTEAEWERVARGLKGQIYPWGDEFDKLKCRNAFSKVRSTCEVNEYPDGKSPDGCYQMAGNVWEWVADRYDWRYYKRDPRNDPRKKDPRPDTDPTGPLDTEVTYICEDHGPQSNAEGNCPVENCGKPLKVTEKFPERVIRGGSWSDGSADLRCAKRSAYPPDYNSFRIGFRCARDAE